MVSRTFDSGTFDSGLFDGLSFGVAQPKMLVAQVFDADGNYIRTLPDWSSEPRFLWPLNSGQGALGFQLARAWATVGAGEPGEEVAGDGTINLGNTIKLYVVDREATDGVLLYQGRLSEYEFDLAGAVFGGTLIPRSSRLMTLFQHDPVVFDNVDPTDMVEYFIDNGMMPGITFDPTNPLVGAKRSPTFEREFVKNMLDRCQSMGGGLWYWRINPDYSLTFKPSPIFEPDHTLIVGRHIAAGLRFHKSDMERRRRVRVYGAPERFEEENGVMVRVQEAIFAEISDVGYDPTTDPLDFTYANSRITDPPTAYRMANSFLEFLNTFFLETEVVVADSNFDAVKGYDIESLKPGQVVQLWNPGVHQHQFRLIGDHVIGDGHIIGGDWLSSPLRPVIIASVDYRWTYVVLKLQLRPNRIVDELVSVSDRVLLEETR